jgi:formylglycine-generating enzyme required for sulfatase activity
MQVTETPPTSVSPILDDRPAAQDALEFAHYCDILSDILRDPGTRTPLTIGLFGTWGSGKTSLMSMIKARIDAAGLPAYRTAWFNAWKYGHEDALWRALILRVLDTLRPRKPDGSLFPEEDLGKAQQTLVQDLDRLEESLYRTVEWQEVGRWTLDWAKALRGTAEGAAEIALAFVPGGAPLVNLIKGAAQAITGEEQQAIAEAFRRQIKTYRREQLRSLEQFEGEFQALLGRHIVRQNGRLIVFVDDLDRCLPEKAIEVLEAIKLFLDVPGCVFVLGLDEEAIVEAIQTRYDGEVRGRQYLEKIIQLPFRLPPIETKDMRSFVDSLVPHLPDNRCSEVFAEGLAPNPRQVKRTINIFLLLWKLSHPRLREAIQPVRLAKVVTIQHSQPDLYALLCEVPRFLRDLEIHFRAEIKLASGPESTPAADAAAKGPPPMPSLPPQLQPFVGRATLRHLLTLHPPDMPDVNFADLTPQDIRPYIYLTRRTEPRLEAPARGAPEPQMIGIPAGEFVMGSTEYEAEKPRQQVYLPAYQIGRYPITNYEYRAFVHDTGTAPPRNWESDNYPEEFGDYPVVHITWYNAVAYCLWLSQKTGKPYRLPSEAEWEKAARAEDGRTWPWGNHWDKNCCNSRESGIGHATPVGQYSPRGDSPYGVADMAGNVWEWCNSLYQPYPYQPDGSREDVQASGDRVLRGGAFLDEARFVRCSYRYKRLPTSHDSSAGFRVASDSP